MSLCHHDACCLGHGLRVLAVYLHGHGPFLGGDSQLLQTAVHHAHECIAGDELGIDHSCSHASAQETESDVRNILHRSQEQGFLPQADRAYPHDTAPPLA